MARRWVDRAMVYNLGGHILHPKDAVAVKYVTVIGEDRDFAVYMGSPELSNEEVAADGDKVSEEEGRAVAPYCSHLHYRT